MMMCIGQFVFQLDTLAYQQLKRRTAWKHPTQALVGARDASQYLGPGEDTITLDGSVVPEFAGSHLHLDDLRYMANTGRAYALVEGTGTIYGAFVITEIEETKSLFFEDGSPRKVEFSIGLRRVDMDDDGRADAMGDLVTPEQTALQ
ncbi:hypothetical protein DFR41_110126 [Pseudacidovorax intermedius]|uniref:Uncharacterized protein n=1 Tax=Pseudacidovorax intermedius TaxID=433924 RepID=A0A370FCZ6_9BURK|nr:phage tail protein [Pseudacidovorax intermedius]RDI20718.1 hypothetical protein DFR41_110126 [Pseudacidovorax intermedius]